VSVSSKGGDEGTDTRHRVLEPPRPCSNTIRGINELESLDRALNRSGIWPVLNASPNVTCLAPNKAAFEAAGSPDSKLDQADLISALTFHTLPQPLYTNFLKDGMEIKSLANLTVRISVNDSGTYFNDAKVVRLNVLTNNGMVHVLDKVMSPINGEKLTAAGGNTSPGNSTGESTTKPSSAASVRVGSQTFAVLGLAMAMLWLL